jgi:hypothetical protein|tara:strand:+ start:3977 stop:5146 length:1170 start_codon:yes stop_codon:yes gene_type:complete
MENHKYADLFPMMSEEEFNRLKADIKENGLLEPIEIIDGKILDGRNRFKACSELGIKPNYITKDNETNLLQYVISKNLHRRHLTASQKATIALKYKPLFAEEAKKRMAISGVELIPQVDKDRARDKAGEVFGVSGRYIDMAEEIAKKKPNELTRITKGEVNITKIYTELKREEADAPAWLRYLDVWNFKENTGDGLSNLPPEILKNLFYYYTNKGDTVLDLFGGSGLTYKIAKELDRECIISDIKPMEDYIIKWDVDKGLTSYPEALDKVKLVFLDPPYLDMIDYGDGWSRLKLDDFYNKFDKLCRELRVNTAKNTYIALIIMPVVRDGKYIDLGLECSKILDKYFSIEQRICVPLARNWAFDKRLTKSKENKKILTSSLRDLIIYKNI